MVFHSIYGLEMLLTEWAVLVLDHLLNCFFLKDEIFVCSGTTYIDMGRMMRTEKVFATTFLLSSYHA